MGLLTIGLDCEEAMYFTYLIEKTNIQQITYFMKQMEKRNEELLK